MTRMQRLDRAVLKAERAVLRAAREYRARCNAYQHLLARYLDVIAQSQGTDGRTDREERS